MVKKHRVEQLKDAADQVENWLDKQIVNSPRLMCVGCGIAGIATGYLARLVGL